MSLTVEDFFSAFADKELKEVKLKTWRGNGDGVLFLRSLSRADVCRFRTLASKIAQRRALNVISGNNSDKEYDDDLSRAENYLLKSSICDNQGKSLFDSDESISKWAEVVPPEIVNEILTHIENLNELYGGFDGKSQIEEEYKKKLESSD